MKEGGEMGCGEWMLGGAEGKGKEEMRMGKGKGKRKGERGERRRWGEGNVSASSYSGKGFSVCRSLSCSSFFLGERARERRDWDKGI